MSLALRFFTAFFLVSFFHRILCYWPLTEFLAYEPSVFDVFFTGFLSDFWISWCVSLTVYLSAQILPIRRHRLWFVSSYFTSLVLVIAHQAYVDFFKFPITPYHLNYLLDLNFIKANRQSLLSIKPLILAAFGILISRIFWLKKAKNQYAKTAALAILAISFHVIHIRIKIQWFIPENLQSHPLERLYEQWLKFKPLKDLNPEELRKLNALLPEFNLKSEETTEQTSAFKKVISDRLLSHKKTNIIIFLLESFRPVDIGAYNQNNSQQKSITPFFDRLAKNGILFRNAYSTGTVTRSGQEAVFCGFPSGANTSLMRNLPQNPRLCFSDFAQEKNITTFWAHGGAENFDNQKSFWIRHKVMKFLTEQDFSQESPRTGWGVSDYQFVNTFSAWLHALTSNVNVGIALTVTNHIPWDLPTDAENSEVIKKLTALHPGYATVNYTDTAIKKLVENLRKNNEWANSLIFFTSDHGHLEKGFFSADDSKDLISRSFLLSTHVSFLMSGGIAEDLLLTEKSLLHEYRQPVSHLDIFKFLTQIFAIKTLQIGEDLFLQKRKWPLFADFGDRIGFLANRNIIEKNKLNESKELDALYARKVWQDFINTLKK